MLLLFVQSALTGFVLTMALLAVRRFERRPQQRARAPLPDARALRCVQKLHPRDL